MEMKDNPLISVIIPTFNAAKFLKPCINSLISQTEQRFEVIFIDDGSTDETINIINASSLRNYKIISGRRNGISSALNLGIRIAKGKYIARMDSDDICFPDRFENQLNEFLADPSLGFCAGNVELLGVDWSFWGAKCISHKDYLTRLLWEMPVCHPAVMWNKRIFEDNKLFYNEAFRDTEDFELFSRAVMKVKFKGVEKPLIKYRIHPNQATYRGDKEYNNYLKIIDRNFYERSGQHVPKEVLNMFWYESTIQKNPIFPLVRVFRSVRSLNELDRRSIRSYILSRYLKYINDNSIKSRVKYTYFYKILLKFLI